MPLCLREGAANWPTNALRKNLADLRSEWDDSVQDAMIYRRLD
jgi:hypothetical protein